jgi:hypothetical protein
MAQSQRHLRSGVPYIYWQNFFVIFDQTQTKFFHRLTLVAIIKILMKTEIIEKPPALRSVLMKSCANVSDFAQFF